MISIFDVALIVLLSGFIFYGLFFGLIRVIGGVAGVVIGAILASRFYLFAYSYIDSFFLGYDNFGHIVAFVLTFFLIRKLVILAFAVLDKIFKIASIIPFLTTFNRLLGATIGLFEGVLILGLLLFVSSKYAIIENWFGEWLATSIVAPWLVKMAGILMPLLPDAIKALNGLI